MMCDVVAEVAVTDVVCSWLWSNLSYLTSSCSIILRIVVMISCAIVANALTWRQASQIIERCSMYLQTIGWSVSSRSSVCDGHLVYWVVHRYFQLKWLTWIQDLKSITDAVPCSFRTLFNSHTSCVSQIKAMCCVPQTSKNITVVTAGSVLHTFFALSDSFGNLCCTYLNEYPLVKVTSVCVCVCVCDQ